MHRLEAPTVLVVVGASNSYGPLPLLYASNAGVQHSRTPASSGLLGRGYCPDRPSCCCPSPDSGSASGSVMLAETRSPLPPSFWARTQTL